MQSVQSANERNNIYLILFNNNNNNNSNRTNHFSVWVEFLKQTAISFSFISLRTNFFCKTKILFVCTAQIYYLYAIVISFDVAYTCDAASRLLIEYVWEIHRCSKNAQNTMEKIIAFKWRKKKKHKQSYNTCMYLYLYVSRYCAYWMVDEKTHVDHKYRLMQLSGYAMPRWKVKMCMRLPPARVTHIYLNLFFSCKRITHCLVCEFLLIYSNNHIIMMYVYVYLYIYIYYQHCSYQ